MNVFEKNSFFKARQTILEMLSDRGYTIPENLHISYDEFNIQYENNNMYIYLEDQDKKFYIYFHTLVKNFSKKDFVSIMNKLNKQYDDHLHVIFVTRDKLNQTLQKEIAKLDNCESFILKSLVFNITKHNLIPQMRLMNKDEIQVLLNEFKIEKHMLPKILETDPISRYYAAKIGDIFKIVRTSVSTGTSVSYRYVK